MWVDNEVVVDSYARGRAWCVDACRPAADLWDLIWAKVEDLGGQAIDIMKVKGHATDADVEAGRVTKWQKAGNDHADHFACMGSALAEHISSTPEARRSFAQAKDWYAWLAVLVENWPSDTQKRGCKRKTGPRPGEGTRKRRRTQLPLGSSPDKSTWSGLPCAANGGGSGEGGGERSSSTPGTNNDANCGPKAPVRYGRGHTLYRSGDMLWCSICGAYAAKRLKSLKEPCTGAAGKGPRAGQLARLLKGEHPLIKSERMPRPVKITHLGSS